MRVMLIGTYPPPFGGTSVHIQRLMAYCEANEVACAVLDPSSGVLRDGSHVSGPSGGKLRRLLDVFSVLRSHAADIAHFHVSAMGKFEFFGNLLVWLSRHRKNVLTIHSGSFVGKYQTAAPWRKRFVRWTLGRFDLIFAVNADQKRFLVDGLGLSPETIQVVPAFIPPCPDVASFMEMREARLLTDAKRAGAVIVLLSGYLERHYGFHDFLDALEGLSPEVRDRIYPAFVFYTNEDYEYSQPLMARIAELKHKAVFRDMKPNTFAALLSSCDILVRPTYVDGDAVAIREAHYFERQVVASNCVARPANTLLFSTGDRSSLAEALTKAIANSAAGKSPAKMENYAKLVLTGYRRLVAKR